MRIRTWFIAYGLYLLIAGVTLYFLARGEHCQVPPHQSWKEWLRCLASAFETTSPAFKLLAFGLYLSICTTLTPLPTGWIVAGMATREAAVAAGVSSDITAVMLVTVLAVAGVGAVASTIANTTDYFLFTAMLRLPRVAKIRTTRLYQGAERWFARSPFFLLLVFSIIPIPVDVVRLLAISYRYSLGKFVAANLIGRFIRYAVFAFVTFYWNLGWIAPVALLGLAVAMAGGKLIAELAKRARA